MDAYRLSGTVAADRTITVRVPEASVGAEAEIIVLFTQADPPREEPHPLRAFLDELRGRPVAPDGASRPEEAQAFLRALREEWD